MYSVWTKQPGINPATQKEFIYSLSHRGNVYETASKIAMSAILAGLPGTKVKLVATVPPKAGA